jgi:K+-sensing histidine kinase KdpD
MTITDKSTRSASEAKVFTEMLLKTKALGSLNAGQYGVVKTVHDNLEKLELLVNDILDVYKLDKGRLKLSKVDVDIASILKKPYLKRNSRQIYPKIISKLSKKSLLQELFLVTQDVYSRLFRT